MDSHTENKVYSKYVEASLPVDTTLQSAVDSADGRLIAFINVYAATDPSNGWRFDPFISHIAAARLLDTTLLNGRDLNKITYGSTGNVPLYIATCPRKSIELLKTKGFSVVEFDEPDFTSGPAGLAARYMTAYHIPLEHTSERPIIAIAAPDIKLRSNYQNPPEKPSEKRFRDVMRDLGMSLVTLIDLEAEFKSSATSIIDYLTQLEKFFENAGQGPWKRDRFGVPLATIMTGGGELAQKLKKLNNIALHADRLQRINGVPVSQMDIQKAWEQGVDGENTVVLGNEVSRWVTNVQNAGEHGLSVHVVGWDDDEQIDHAIQAGLVIHSPRFTKDALPGPKLLADWIRHYPDGLKNITFSVEDAIKQLDILHEKETAKWFMLMAQEAAFRRGNFPTFTDKNIEVLFDVLRRDVANSVREGATRLKHTKGVSAPGFDEKNQRIDTDETVVLLAPIISDVVLPDVDHKDVVLVFKHPDRRSMRVIHVKDILTSENIKNLRRAGIKRNTHAVVMGANAEMVERIRRQLELMVVPNGQLTSIALPEKPHDLLINSEEMIAVADEKKSYQYHLIDLPF